MELIHDALWTETRRLSIIFSGKVSDNVFGISLRVCCDNLIWA